MKIAIITQPWAGVGEGGAIGLITCKLASRLARSEDVTIFGRSGMCDGDTKVKVRHISIAFERKLDVLIRILSRLISPGEKSKPYFSRLFYYFLYAYRIALILKKEKFDVVHIHMLSQFIPVIRMLNPGIKIVLHHHLEWIAQLDRNMLKKRLDKADLIIEGSRYNLHLAVSRFPEYKNKCRICHNGVDKAWFSIGENRSESGSKIQGTTTLLFVSRISPEKGVHILLRAFEKVYERHRNIRLVIVGPDVVLPLEHLVSLNHKKEFQDLRQLYTGEEYPLMVRKMLKGDAARQVEFVGYVPNKLLPEYYAKSDIFVNSSFIETFPLPVIEAMASGLPVVASKVGGIPEAVESGKCGILYRAGNIDSLAAAIDHLLMNPQLRIQMGQTARDRACKNYSWDTIADRLLSDYRNLMRVDTALGTAEPGVRILRPGV